MRHARHAVKAASLFLALACGERADGPVRGVTDPAAERAQGAAGGASAAAPGASAAAYWSAQKLIRNAELRIEVKDVVRAVQLADSALRQGGALVTESRTTQDERDRREAHLVVRVPSDRLGDALAALRRLGEVKEESVSAQDVTKEYADLETRLAVKEQTVTRLRALIENRTAKLADVLEVERELARAVTELEEMKGERRYLDQQIALSTIKITFVDHAATRGDGLVGPVGEAFGNSVDVLGKSLSGLIYVITFLLPWAAIALPVWWLVRWARSRRGGTGSA